ncbi:lasso peptide biosynthesis B2 protein [Streptomyces goshikiensis]|uniref:lasso peptide biosynthesis B2 protein n=1 Tax=Streptomyces goshikiensis TaxID=1942 RepID=UPI002E15A36C|nr:lasso peptide biosynthesis B2 protein [Streptomyces goshikiensis]WSY00440.1 lasso peptide biosynthesis B2 protein [Streptomyces goshikiensis]
MIPVPTAETRTAVTDRAGVIVNYRTGATVVLTGGALDEWLSAVRQGNAPKPVVVTNPGASWGTHETAARLESHGSPPWPWRVAALACVALTLTVRQTGRSEYRFGRLVRLASVGGALPPASAVHARTAVRSVRWAARAIPARVACLEESTAASVLLAAGGRGNAWRHGVAADPIRLHAWICDEHGRPVEEPGHTGDYTPINTANSSGAEPR